MERAAEPNASPRTLREAWREPDFRALALAAAIACFARLWEGTLDGDPVVYASIAKDIARSGDWLNLQLGWVPYFNKPPLLFWLTASLFLLFGTSTFAACFWSAAFGAASVLALHRLGREVFDRNTAFLGALVLLLTPEMLRYASRFRLESVSVFFLILAILEASRAVRRRDPRPLTRAGIWVGLLLLAKGGPAFIALLCVVALLVWERAGSLLASRAAGRGLAWMLVLGLAWPVSQWWQHGMPYLERAIGMELLQRDEVRIRFQNPLLFYPLRLLKVYWIWLPCVALGARRLWRERREQRHAFRLLVVWIVVGGVLISVPERKFARYLTSLYPATALLAGYWIARAIDAARIERLRSWVPRLALAAAAVLVCLPFPIHPDNARPARQLGALLDALAPPGAPVAGYRSDHGFWRGEMHFYLDRAVQRYDDLDSLEASGAPLVLCFWRGCAELEAAGWKQQLRSWRWKAYLRPGVPPGAASVSSRRLQ